MTNSPPAAIILPSTLEAPRTRSHATGGEVVPSCWRATPGDPADWDRYLIGLRDLQGILAHWTQSRELSLRIRAHLTAAIAFGRVFNQAGGWRPTIQGRHADVYPSDNTEHRQLKTALDKGGSAADFSVEIDLLDVKVSDLASDVLRQLPNPATNRLCVWREESRSELAPNDVTAMAAITSRTIRDAAFDIRPSRIHLFCASPVEFGVLVGHRLTSLHADIHLYERDGNKYVSSLVIPANI